MAQSLPRVQLHLIFATKHREPTLVDDIRPRLHGYMATVLGNLRCPVVVVNSVEDHVHLLFALSSTVTISRAIEEVKKSSCKWLKRQSKDFSRFVWQAGYAVFSVSESNVASVRRYIENQRAHHRRKTFQEEYLQFLERHRIAYDERYVFD
jgi:putative transposase